MQKNSYRKIKGGLTVTMRYLIFTFILILGISAQHVGAQSHGVRKGDRIEVQLNYLLGKVPYNMQDVPLNTRRIALFDIRSEIPKVYLSMPDLRNQLTQQLMNSGLQVLMVPEFDDRVTLKIRSSDSIFKVDNRSALTRLKSDPKKLIEVCQDYNIQGLFNCNVYYDSLNGPKISMTIVHPANRNILWVKQIDLSSDVIVDPHKFTMGVGMGIQKLNEIKGAPNDTILGSNLSVIPLSLTMTYTQVVNANRNSEFGVQLTLRSIDQTPTKYVDQDLGALGRIIVPSGGITYQASFLRKQTILPNYWMYFQLGLNYFYFNQSFLGVHQRLGVRLTESLTFDIKLEQTFNNYTSRSSNGLYQINLDNLNYGAQISYAF